jgi:hypothetical protein
MSQSIHNLTTQESHTFIDSDLGSRKLGSIEEAMETLNTRI